MISKTTLGVAAGLVGVVAYCFYFDRKRRSDPLFRQKLKESELNFVYLKLTNYYILITEINFMKKREKRH